MCRCGTQRISKDGGWCDGEGNSDEERKDPAYDACQQLYAPGFESPEDDFVTYEDSPSSEFPPLNESRPFER